MNVLHVITSLGHGGRERRMVQLVKDLYRQHEIRQQIVVLRAYVNDYASDVPGAVEILPLEYSSKYRIASSLYSVIKENRPDIVHVWTEIPLILSMVTCCRYCFKYKLVIGFLADGNRVNDWKCRFVNQLAYGAAKAIVSNSVAGIIAKRAPKHKSHVIYNGFDFKRFHDFDENELRMELECKDRLLVSMVARFSNAKNWDMFLRVASIVKEQVPEILFLAVGSGENEERYRSLAVQQEIDNVKFLGRRSDVENIFRISTLSVLFSNEKVHAEGVSNSIMESMAAGTPVIATDGGGTPEIITDGVDGYIIPPNDSEAAATKIIELCTDVSIRDSFALNARSKIERKFVLSEVSDRYLQLYKSL